MKEKKFIFSFDPTVKARFGILPRYAKNEMLIRWFELPNCFIFHNGEQRHSVLSSRQFYKIVLHLCSYFKTKSRNINSVEFDD